MVKLWSSTKRGALLKTFWALMNPTGASVQTWAWEGGGGVLFQGRFFFLFCEMLCFFVFRSYFVLFFTAVLRIVLSNLFPALKIKADWKHCFYQKNTVSTKLLNTFCTWSFLSFISFTPTLFLSSFTSPLFYTFLRNLAFLLHLWAL